ncbi:MAG: aminotransferase class V-fold PLP-dependent enzyme [Clostridia bacterium]|nr:aminotransferase class V-fold PLP-dependent enzyme [Clostridia bacterium]
MNKRTVYLDNAATTFPKPESVCYEMYKCTREYCGNPGRGTNSLAIKASETIYETRARLKEFFFAPTEDNVIFTFNATYALNIAIKCFIPQHTHVLISDIEHNAVYRPVIAQAIKGKLSFDFFSTHGGDGQRILADIIKKTRRNTSAVICTAASNICNLTLPIDEIGSYCKKRGILFILDASQYAGHRELNIQKQGISILCAPAHKGLYGPQGLGFMVIGEDASPICTLIEGGSGVNSKDLSMPKTLPEMLEAGTLNTQNAKGLSESLKYLSSIGFENIISYERYLSENMKQMLIEHKKLTIHGDYGEGCVFSVSDEDMSTEELADSLNEYGVMIRSGLHCAPLAHKTIGTSETGTVRFSLGIFNTLSDIEYTDDVLKKVLYNNSCRK